MSAEEKEKVLAQWLRFLKNGLQWQDFTKQLYQYLHLHCDFIAHYNIHGFYEEYFLNGADKIRFLNQFDWKEFTKNGWYAYKLTGEYGDLNSAMVEAAEKFLPVLYAGAKNEQKQKDLLIAERLLARHGLTLADSHKTVKPPADNQIMRQASLF